MTMHFSGDLQVTQLAVPLRTMSNFISCKNMKIPLVVVTWFTQQTEKEEEEEEGGGGRGGGEMREGEVCACLLDGSQGKTWQEP